MSDNGKPNGADLGLFATEEVRRVYLPGTTHWVEIKRELDLGEESELESAALRGVEQNVLAQGAEATNKVMAVFDLGRQRILKLAMYVVAWSFRDARGRMVDIPPELTNRMELMKRLRPAWGTKILEVIDKQREDDLKALDESGESEPERESPKAGESGAIVDLTPSSPSADLSPAGLPRPSDG